MLKNKIKNKRGDRSPLFPFRKQGMITVDKIRKLADEKLAEGDNFIVDISVKPGNKIVVLLDNDRGISIAECVAMSRHIESSLDREEDDFELSVMSPGLSEPFKIARQYQKNIGKEVDVVTTDGKKMSGRIMNVSDEGIVLETKTREKVADKKTKQTIINNINLTFNQIKETKVVITF